VVRLAPFLTCIALVAACAKERAETPPAPSHEAGAPSALASFAPPTEPARADASASAPIAANGACPSGMVLVDGNYCPEPVQICERWLDPPGEYHEYRCAEYAKPSRCPGARVHERFCIDREEYVAPGETDDLPLANQSWTSAGEVCATLGERLCLESEWQFACEGEEMRPYPYGFVRDATACNIDRMDLGRPNAGLRDLRAPVTAYPRCVSPFGVHDMSGNIEEWATLDHGRAPQRSTMKGAWWLPGKNTCRARTLGHGEIYRGKQVGVRCCANAK